MSMETQPVTETAPHGKVKRQGRKAAVVTGLLIVGGLAVLCVVAAGGGAAYFGRATAQARGTQTEGAGETLATAAAGTATANALMAENTATAGAFAAQATATALADYADSTATAQARAEASTATAVVLAASTPTLAVAAPAAENWPLVVLDTFEANTHGWVTGTFDDQYGTGSREVAEGKYHWEATAKGQGRLWWATFNDRQVTDGYVAVDVSVVAGDAYTRYGLVVRHNGKDYDLFDAGQNGKFGFYRWEGGRWTTLIGLTPSAAIDPAGVNRLAVLAQGQQFTLYVNGQQVGAATEDHLTEGYTGLALNLSQPAARAVVEFANFELRTP